MTLRFKHDQLSGPQFKAMAELSAANRESRIEHGLQCLIEIRASQLNGCAFCLDMHIKQATIGGERPLRLHHIAIWRESPLFSERERAALAWTEALTRIPEDGVSDALFHRVREHFDDKALSDLTYLIATINAWNRLNVATRGVPGTYDRMYGLDKAGLN